MNDVPAQMVHVITLIERLGIDVEVQESSDMALDAVRSRKFDAIISDMQRLGIQDEGIRFLGRLRRLDAAPPVIFTVGAYRPDLGTPAFAFGIASRVDECLNLLFDALERARGRRTGQVFVFAGSPEIRSVPFVRRLT